MFGLFKKDPVKKLEEQYSKKMEEAINAQRNGDIDGFSKLSFEADQIDKQIEELKKQ
tara:strand:- start:37999 stop:38169 length:171 start_codon:yes stop_codon:yes gene_type:complete